MLHKSFMSEAMTEDPDLGSDPDLVQDLSQFSTGTSVVNGSKRKISTAKAAGRPKGPWWKHYYEEGNGGDRKDASWTATSAVLIAPT
jgi:hypothetical protein